MYSEIVVISELCERPLLGPRVRTVLDYSKFLPIFQLGACTCTPWASRARPHGRVGAERAHFYTAGVSTAESLAPHQHPTELLSTSLAIITSSAPGVGVHFTSRCSPPAASKNTIMISWRPAFKYVVPS